MGVESWSQPIAPYKLGSHNQSPRQRPKNQGQLITANLVGDINPSEKMLVKMGSFSPKIGVKIKKIFELPPPSNLIFRPNHPRFGSTWYINWRNVAQVKLPKCLPSFRNFGEKNRAENLGKQIMLWLLWFHWCKKILYTPFFGSIYSKPSTWMKRHNHVVFFRNSHGEWDASVGCYDFLGSWCMEQDKLKLRGKTALNLDS